MPSNDLVIRKAKQKNLPIEKVQSMWDESKNEVRQQGLTEKEYAQAVKDRFLEKCDELDIKEAKNIMDSRDRFEKASGEFLDAIQTNNYTKAKEVFPEVVDAKLQNIINTKKNKFLQDFQKRMNSTGE